MTEFRDIYVSGAPEDIEALLSANRDTAAAIIEPRILDGLAHACVRLNPGEELELPGDLTKEEVTRFPETARMAVGVFMADPEPPEPPEPEEG